MFKIPKQEYLDELKELAVKRAGDYERKLATKAGEAHSDGEGSVKPLFAPRFLGSSTNSGTRPTSA